MKRFYTVTDKPDERFWAKVNKDGPIPANLSTPCWVWTASVRNSGYGQFKIPGTMALAHRVVMGNPKGKIVCHHCDNKLCVNPEHLFIGRHTDNNQDMVAKDRHSRGERQPGSKLTEETVMKIRSNDEGLTQDQRAAKYGVSQSLISMVVHRHIWKHL